MVLAIIFAKEVKLMGYAAAAVILILILAWLLMRMKIHLTFEYLHDKDNDKLTFKISALYGLIRIKKRARH